MTDLDKISRDKICNDINSNFFVEAGAGSGKTTVLVRRMVAMVEGGLDISKICAITFTKAAAGEFYARFQKKLSESGSPAAQKALKDIDLCFLGTIDSFCNMVLSEHPAAAKIPSDASVLDEDAMAACYQKAYSDMLRGEYGDALKEKAVRFSSSFYGAKDAFIDCMKKHLMGSRNAQLNYVKPPAGGPDEFFGERKARLLSVLKYLKDHPEALAQDKPKDAAASFDVLMHDSAVIFEDWDNNIANVQYTLNKLQKLRIIKEYEGRMDELGPGWESFFEPHISRNKLAWYEIASDTDPLLFEAVRNYQFSVAADFFAACTGPVAAKLRAEGSLGFFDYLLYLRDLLKEDAAKDGRLIKHIYDRHSYFLIDEFQDTNPLQAEIFFYLTANEPKANWRECVPKPGSLFIVGDPKQSIYRFRNADVGSYLKVKALFTGEVGEVLYLTRNFRSTDVMCGWFNEVFTRLLPEDTLTQSRFNPIPTGEKPAVTASLSGAYSYSVQLKDMGEIEPEVLAGIIRKLIDDPSYTIQDRGKSVPRRIEYRDIMLITPSKGKLSDFMNAFRKYGIPFRVEGKVVFGETPALRSVAYVMSAAADLSDRKARFAAMKLSGLGIDDDGLAAYFEKGKTVSSAAMFSLILDEQQVFAKAGAENAENVYFALELLRAAESAGEITSLKDGAEFINGLINGESDQERCIQLLRDSNRIHMANLHKVKGLEAPVVILAAPMSKTFEPEFSVDYSGDVPQSYLFKIGDAIKCSDFSDKKDNEALALAEEKVRLLYVAATRAGNAIIIGKAVKQDGDIAAGCPWLPLVEMTDREFPVTLPKEPERGSGPVDAAELYRQAEAQSVLRSGAPFEKSYEIVRPSMIKIKGLTDAEDDYSELTESERRNRKKNPALIGTMVHRMMEVLVSSKGKADLNALISETLKEYEADDQYYRGILADAGAVMLAGGYDQPGTVPKDILHELLSADEVYCELPFCYKEDDIHIWNGVMDVVYRKAGAWHIIDYKTNADGSDLDAKYQAQLEAYIKAFRQMTGENADARTYHIEV